MVQSHNWLITSQALYQLHQVAVLFMLVYYRRCHCQWLSQYMGIRSARLQPLTCGTINSQNRYCMHTLNILTQPTNKQQWWSTCLLTVACPASWVFLHAGRVKQIEISNVFVLYLPYNVMSWMSNDFSTSKLSILCYDPHVCPSVSYFKSNLLNYLKDFVETWHKF